ncbi:cytochrome P450 [Pseudonocardia sp. N23]|uniref:cytochrome P450 n=1 Tax=Pseudonocardia sp. N23 TaxID=1987376 RepID=UPI000BFE5D79|nr:cytochrome P450 [Pseudonocardia sp. N23]GAY07196.1 putative cytochrome P450 hydroxylase [Pseudonocardia sp. N23]
MTAVAEDAAASTIVLSTFADAKDAYRSKDLRQSLYDEGEVVMSDVLVNLHGREHRDRRRVENRMFRRDVFERYERELFPEVTVQTLAPYLDAGRVDLVHLGHELMLNLSALTAGIDRPLGTAEETKRLFDYNAKFIEGATLAHSTGDKAALSREIAQALEEWDEEFLAPSIARRLDLLAREAAGEDVDVPRDVLATLLRHRDELELPQHVIRREVAFFLLAGAHTSATAFVRAIDHILGWLDEHPADEAKVRDDALFVQRCIHETVRLNPSSPTGRRIALAPVTLKSGQHIPEGATVVIDLQAINRDTSFFGADAADFDPTRTMPPGVAPFGLSFGGGMHVCIGQDLAAGVVAGPGTDPDDHLHGLVTGAVRHMFGVGVRRDPDNAPQRDAATARPYWGTYPVLLGGGS